MNHYLHQAYAEIAKFCQSVDDVQRLRRGLKLAEANEPFEYATSLLDCTCPDREHRQVICKHMRAMQIEVRAEELVSEVARMRALAPDIYAALQVMYRHFETACILAGTADRHPALQAARDVMALVRLPKTH